jgi:CheY-like chemotaxis protein
VVQLSSCAGGFDVLLADAAAAGAAADAPASAPRSGLLTSCKDLPIVLMGADATPDDVMRGVALGAADFLAKPASQLKLRNIWQHTVRRMMGAGTAAAPAPAGLGRSASNGDALAAAALAAPEAPSAPKPPAGLPPRSPPLRARRHNGGSVPGGAMHACISSTNLAAGARTTEDEDFDFDAAAAAPDDDCCLAPHAPAAAPAAPSKAPTASGTTATVTHVSVPPPSCGVPVHGAGAAQLPSGMVWGMPMPVVRAPGIVPPRGGVPAARGAAAPSWGYLGCPMPPPGYLAPQPYMMPPPGMCGPSYYSHYGPMSMYGAPQQAQQQAHPQQQQHQQHQQMARQPTGAAAAQALEASLMTLLGGAEDDDLDVDLDDIMLQDLAAAPCAKPPAAAAPAPSDCGTACSEGSDGDAATLLHCGSGSDCSPRGSFESRRAPAGAAAGGDDLAALLGGAGDLGMDVEDWEAAALPHLKKSGSLADLLAAMA